MKKKKILIVNSINEIPSNQQYFHLGLKLASMGYNVIHIKDNSRNVFNYPGTILQWKNKKIFPSLFFFAKIIFRYKRFHCVILNFRGRNFSPLFYFFSKQTITTYRSDFFPTNFFSRVRSSFCFLFSTNVLTISYFIQEKVEKNFFFTRDKTIVLHNSIDSRKISESNIHISKRRTEVPGIIFVGNLGYHKGFDLLIEFMLNNKSWEGELTIVGEGSLVSMIPENDSRINYKGRLSHKETMSLIKQNDFLILPSREEAFGQVIIEAYALETIPVVIRGVGSQELIAHNKSGFIGEDIEDCFAHIKACSSEKIVEMRDNIREYQKQFRMENWVLKMSDFIK